MSVGSANTKEGKSPAPFEGVLKMLSPDGYYTYLGIEKPKPTEDNPVPTVDEDQIKKNYRKLSLRHHPDRPTGDADTFRVLNRAQQVLSNPKLRQQYDLLGLDLDDDEEHEGGDGANDGDEGQDGDRDQTSANQDSVMSQIASMTLASIFQVIVRTGECHWVFWLLMRNLSTSS
jgi:DnaJ-class molecular chaperone